MIFPDILGIANSWIIAKHYDKKSSKERAEMEQRLKEYLDRRLESYLKPFMQNATSEQKAEIQSTVRSSTTAIIEILKGTIEGTSNLTGRIRKTTEEGPGYSPPSGSARG